MDTFSRGVEVGDSGSRNWRIGVGIVLVTMLATLTGSPSAVAGEAPPLPPNLIPATIQTSEEQVPLFFDPTVAQIMIDTLPEGSWSLLPFSVGDLALSAPGKELYRFIQGEPFKMRLEFFFDRYEEGKNVQDYTDQIAALAVIGPGSKAQPPTCLLSWGTSLSFRCVLESFNVKYTLFLDDGTPVRAIMDCTFKEFTAAPGRPTGAPGH